MTDINTPEFRRWFGKSQLVGADGRPLVLFHATRTYGGTWGAAPSKPFSEFKLVQPDSDYFYHFGSIEQAMDRVSLTSIDGDEPVLGDAARQKNALAQVRIYAVFIRMENPLVVKDIGAFKGLQLVRELRRVKIVDDKAVELVKAQEKALSKEIQKLNKKYDVIDANDADLDRLDKAVKIAALEFDITMMQQMRSWMEAAGYDGLKYKNTNEGWGADWSYAALRSEQVKAINNSGRWSRRTKDVFNGLS